MKSLVPAYGHDYKSVKEVYAGLAAGHDFQLSGVLDGGAYVTQAELLEAGETKVLVRYGKLRKQGVFGLPAPGTNAGYTLFELLVVLGAIGMLMLGVAAVVVATHFIMKFW